MKNLLEKKTKFTKQLNNIKIKKSELEEKLKDPQLPKKFKQYSKVSKEYNEIKEKFFILKKIIKTIKQIIDNKKSLDSDPIFQIKNPNIEKKKEIEEMKELFESEILELENNLKKFIKNFNQLQLKEDPDDKGNAIIEIRAGAGGEEASLFAFELTRAYTKFAQNKGFQIEIASINYSDNGGYKHATFFIKGKNAYKYFKYESGVHRVQRVPVTESSGRLHTSTVSVVVLSERDDLEIKIDENDLRIDVYRASGPGGQSVNTTDSAVRIVHTPTQITVTCQDQKSQHKNKAKALKILQAKLYDIEQEKQAQKQDKIRRSAIKGGDRSAKIRTYNFPQSRITDHRINQDWHNTEEIMNGAFDNIYEALYKEDIKHQLQEQN